MPLRQFPENMETRTPDNEADLACSVLIRTFNSGGTLGAVLERLGGSSIDEILVVDSGSTDETLRIAESFGARIIRVEGAFHYSSSLNLGFEVAGNAWVVVISSHCIPVRDKLLPRIRKSISRMSSDAVVIYGRCMLFAENLDPAGYCEYDLDDWRSRKIRGGNGFAVYRKSAWEEKAFDETIPTAEDMEWLRWHLRQGRKAGVEQELVAMYRNKGSLRYMFRKGWIEFIMGFALMEKTPRVSRVLRYPLGPVIISAKMGQCLIRRRIDLRSAIRSVAHSCGAAAAGCLVESGLIKVPVMNDDTKGGGKVIGQGEREVS